MDNNSNTEQNVKKPVLTKNEAEWFEKHKGLPLYNENNPLNFGYMLLERIEGYSADVQSDIINRMIKAYYTGYDIEEKKYYIKPKFSEEFISVCLVVSDNGKWHFSPFPVGFEDGKSKFTQAELYEMQKNPQAEGLDLDVLKVEAPV